MKICIVCSHGGHLTELQYMIGAFEGHDIFFVTYDNIRTQNLNYKKYLYPNLGEGKLFHIPFRMLKHLPSFVNILRREKPDLILSNGAEIAIPFFYLSKLFRIKTIFTECYTRIDAPTITGKVVYPVSDLFLVLWPEMLSKYGKKALYLGGLFNLESSKHTKAKSRNQILVITGMHSDFERLVKKMDEIAGQIDENVIIQSGNTNYIPRNSKYFKFKEYDDIKKLIKNSKVVICQGAMTVIDVLVLGTPVITVPRLKEYGEVIDDHQLFFVSKLKEHNLVIVINNLDELECRLKNSKYPYKKKIEINNEFICQLKLSITSLFKKRLK